MTPISPPSPLILVLKYWKYITIALLSLLLIISLFYINSLNNTIQLRETQHELEITTMKAEYVDTAREIERKAYAQQIEAINEYKKREEILVNDATDSRNAVAELSSTIQALSSIAERDSEFRVKYSNTTGKLLETCSGRYSELATTTDRIANNLRLIEESRK